MSSRTEVIDAEQTSSGPGQALQASSHGGGALALTTESGVMALALMSEETFTVRLQAMKKGQERVRIIQKELMQGPSEDNPEGIDYGVIPGTKKPTLLKPGAETICNVYGLVATFDETWIEGDGIVTPHLRCRIKCQLHKGTADGPVIGEGVGAANSWERKHRYRAAQRACPSCGVEGTIKRSSFEKDGDKGWYCHAKTGGCGASFRSTDSAITEQEGGKVDNPDPYDVENTLLKMAKKRAHVDATLTATATSGLFAQDLEDIQNDGGEQGARPSGAKAGPATQGAQAPAAQPAGKPPAAKGQASGGRWTGPCPKCGKAEAVIQNKRDGVGWFCWPGATRGKGCGYKWTAEDVAMHAEAQEARAAHGGDGVFEKNPAALTPDELAAAGIE